MNGFPLRAFDEEDVALSAMRSFLDEAQKGRFYRWQNGGELWQLLLTITTRTAFAYRRREMRDKRGRGRVRDDSAFAPGEIRQTVRSLTHAAPARELPPDQSAALVEEAEKLLDALPDESLRRVALRKLAGYTNEEIAEELGCVKRTVERKLERIRNKWLERVPRSACTRRRSGGRFAGSLKKTAFRKTRVGFSPPMTQSRSRGRVICTTLARTPGEHCSETRLHTSLTFIDTVSRLERVGPFGRQQENHDRGRS
jgi:RNA polymerase sigma factor (sigma-70 family)